MWRPAVGGRSHIRTFVLYIPEPIKPPAIDKQLLETAPHRRSASSPRSRAPRKWRRLRTGRGAAAPLKRPSASSPFQRIDPRKREQGRVPGAARPTASPPRPRPIAALPPLQAHSWRVTAVHTCTLRILLSPPSGPAECCGCIHDGSLENQPLRPKRLGVWTSGRSPRVDGSRIYEVISTSEKRGRQRKLAQKATDAIARQY